MRKFIVVIQWGKSTPETELYISKSFPDLVYKLLLEKGLHRVFGIKPDPKDETEWDERSKYVSRIPYYDEIQLRNYMTRSVRQSEDAYCSISELTEDKLIEIVE